MTSSGSTIESCVSASPFIKWVGGKRQLLPEIDKRLPATFDVYVEPFLGGGSLFFHLANRLNAAYLSDINDELILVYKAVQENVPGLIKELSKHKNNEKYFQKIRDADRSKDYHWSWSPIEKAARFIYLNKTCFNGLYRVNSKGHFNVPYGRYSNPTIVDIENLYKCSNILNERNVTLSTNTYRSTLDMIQNLTDAGRNVFVYLDPPYIPLSVTSSFTQYSKDGFSMADHMQLRDFCDSLSIMGVHWMQSNSSAPIVFQLYDQYTIETVSAKRSVSASSSGRSPVLETIIRNY